MSDYKLDIEVRASLNKFKKDLEGMKTIVNGFSKTMKDSFSNSNALNGIKNATTTANAKVKDMANTLKGLNGKTFKVTLDAKNKMNNGGSSDLLTASAISGIKQNNIPDPDKIRKSTAAVEKSKNAWDSLRYSLIKIKMLQNEINKSIEQIKLDRIKEYKTWLKEGSINQKMFDRNVERATHMKEQTILAVKLRINNKLMEETRAVGKLAFTTLGLSIKVANGYLFKFTGFMTSTFKKTLLGIVGLAKKLIAPFKAFIPMLSIFGAIRSVSAGLTASMDNEETVSMFFQAFKSGADGAKDRIDNLALALGLNTTEMYKGSAGLRVLLGNLTGSAKQADSMALSLTELAADLSSFYNMDNEQVLDNLKSGLSGQSMALRKYGIDLNGASTAQERFARIMAQTKDAQGDLARTQNSLANQTRRLKNSFKDLANAWGDLIAPLAKLIIPHLIKAVVWVTNLFNAFSRLFGGKTATATKGIVDDSYDMADGLDNATDSAKELQKTLAGFDEINVIGQDKGSDSSSAITGGGYSGGVVDTTALEEQQSKADEIAAKFDEIAQKIMTFIAPAIPVFEGLWTIIKRIVTETLPEWFERVYDIMDKIGLLDLFNWLFNGFTKLVEYLSGDGFFWIDKVLKLFLDFTAISFILEMGKATVALIINTGAWIKNTIAQTSTKIGTVIAFIVQVTSALWLQIPPLYAAAAGWIALNAPIIAIVAAIALVVGAFIYLWKTNDDFRNAFINAWEGIKNFFKGVGDWFREVFTDLGNFFRNFKLPKWLQTVVDFLGGKSKASIEGDVNTNSYIPALAKGGLTTGATLAMIGEGKYQEAVLPMSDNVFSKIAEGISSMMGNNGSGVNGGTFVIQNVLDGKILSETVIDNINSKIIKTGKSPILI